MPYAFLKKEPRPVAASEAVLVEEMMRRVRAGAEDPFYLIDLAAVQERVERWRYELPTVEPFYAVKCNPDASLLSVLSAAGVGFDCASRDEMAEVLRHGVDPSRIIYANPCKQPSHLAYAARAAVSMTVFDSEAELAKTAAWHPASDLVLRVAVDDSQAQCVMSDKYGAPLAAVPYLLRRAAELGVRVRGVSFHVGSGCYSASAFADAIQAASHVHSVAAATGAPMDLLDIGGGFPGVDTPRLSFGSVCTTIRAALQEHFPAERGTRVIAEPGRFIAASSHTLAVNVIGKKTVQQGGDDQTMYYVNDGLYGSFNCVVYDHASPEFKVLPDATGEGWRAYMAAAGSQRVPEGFPQPSSIWGPTCDGFDCITKHAELPALEVGRWLYVTNMGAYTAAAGSTFNGMPSPTKHFLQQPADPLPPNQRMAPVMGLPDAVAAYA